MEEKAPIRSAMVSRLPKFGGRSSTGGSSPLSNGSTQPTTPSQDGKTTPPGTRTNGVVHASPFSMKWKKDEGTTPPSPSIPINLVDGGEDKAPKQLPSVAKEVKKVAPGTPKTRRSGSLTVAVSSPAAIPKQPLKMSSKVGTKLGQSPLNGGPKMGPIGSSIPARTGSDSRLLCPSLGSGSPRSSSQDSLSQSSDSLKTLALDNMVRSNSFTHFKQIPSPTNQPMKRSFSFNRAVELAKPLANTQLRPRRSSFLKPPQLSNGRVGVGLGNINGSLGGGGLGGLQYSRTPPAASSLPTLSIPPAPSTPRALRKPLLPSCVLTKPLSSSGGPLGYRLARSGQAKQQKPLFPGKVKGDIKPPTTPECDGLEEKAVHSKQTGEFDKADPYSDSDGCSGDGEGKRGVLIVSSDQVAGETLEDMSLSSASSLERVNISEEFLDDFDSVGDVFSDGDLPDNRKTGKMTQTPLHSFLNETLDWDSMDLEGHKDESPMQDSQGPLGSSSEHADGLQASSLELSPSNSSGGTYMWDEDGLEPLGAPRTLPCDSYDDSELNSMDILNNLDPQGNGELDDDDLMLDVDLPEDGLHDPDRMSHIERSERASRQGQRRKHHRWSGQEHFHNDSRANVLQQYDSLKSSRISAKSLPSEDRQQSYVSALDEITLRHMSQDCSSLKNQLLRLRTLLQLEDTDSPVEVPEDIEDNTTATQLGELIKEVQVLREELRSRDKTIAQLSLQCQQLQQQQREQMPAQGRQFRCQCHHQRAPSSLRQSDRQLDKRYHYDKATQTYGRPSSHTGVLPTPLLSPWQAQHQGLTRTSMPQRRQIEECVFYSHTITLSVGEVLWHAVPQILQPFNPCLSEQHHQGKLVKPPRTEGRSDLTQSRSEEATQIDADCLLEELGVDMSEPADLDKSSHLLDTHRHRQDSEAPRGVTNRDRPVAAAQHEQRAPAVKLQNSITPKPDAGSTCPCLLQPPRLHKRMHLPALKPRGAGNSGCSLSPSADHGRQLPPPTRGLPCFNAGPQARALSLCRTSQLQPRKASEPCRNQRSPHSSQEEPDQGVLKNSGSAKILIPLSRSCLPKPKIP